MKTSLPKQIVIKKVRCLLCCLSLSSLSSCGSGQELDLSGMDMNFSDLSKTVRENKKQEWKNQENKEKIKFSTNGDTTCINKELLKWKQK